MSRLIAGVDEAGRGPLAGPVVVAAVILGKTRGWSEVTDSKLLPAERRQVLAEMIKVRCLAWRVCVVPREQIDRVNILQATLLGMAEVIDALAPRPERVLVDGNCTPAPGTPVDMRAVIGGDRVRKCIAAASILAKTTRDAYMCQLDRRYPGYNFAAHKGYATPEHLACLQRLGPTPEHRRSFAPVAQCLQASLL